MTRDDILEQRKILVHERWKRRMHHLAWYALLAEVFFLALSPTAATIAMLVSGVATIARLRIDEDFSFRHLPLDVPAVLFVLLAGASVLVSPDRAFSFYNYYNLVGAYALTYFLVGQNVRTPQDVRAIFSTLAVAAIFVVLYGYYQFAFGIDIMAMRWVDGNAFPELRKRVFSTWENPNILAGYLDICICLAFGLLVYAGTKIKRIVLGIFILALVVCLSMTYARGALLVMAVILAGYGVLRDWRVLVACLGIGTLLLALDPVLYERLLSVFTKVDTSTEMRLAFWESTLQMIQDHPFMGIGWGAYYLVYPSYDFYMQGANILIVHAHNMYLNYMAEIGIPGAAAFFWFFFGSMGMALRLVFRAPAPKTPEKTPFSYTSAPADEELQRVEQTVSQDEEQRIAWQHDFSRWEDYRFLGGSALGLGLAFVSVALNGLTDDLLFNIPSSMFLWMLAALAAGLCLMHNESYAQQAELSPSAATTAEDVVPPLASDEAVQDAAVSEGKNESDKKDSSEAIAEAQGEEVPQEEETEEPGNEHEETLETENDKMESAENALQEVSQDEGASQHIKGDD